MPSIRTTCFFATLVSAVLLALVVLPVSADDGKPAPPEPRTGTAIGNLAPDFTAENYHGGEVTLSDHRGKVILLDFWASWCGPCMHEMPTLVEVKTRYPADKFTIIGVSLDMEKTLPRMKKVIADNSLDYPIPYDGKGWRNAVAAIYGIRSIPATFILDEEGVIVASNLRGRELIRKLDELVTPNR